MTVPGLLIERVPPSASQLLDLARKVIDDSMLWAIARADYGYRADEAFAELRLIRDSGVTPAPMPDCLPEVLELTRWHVPEHADPPPFEPGPTGRRGHQIRMFACAALLSASSDPTSRYVDIADDSTLVNCLVSARMLGPEFSPALGSWLTCRWPSMDCSVLAAVALLTIAFRLPSHPIEEPDAGVVADWVLAQEQASCTPGGTPRFSEPRPVAFSLQQGLWRAVADELGEEAQKLADPAVREKVQLCALLLDPGWHTAL